MLSVSEIEHLYPFPAIRCRRIVRTTERILGDFHLDGRTALELGTESIGVFLGNCRALPDLIDQFQVLAESDLPGQIVIALATKATSEAFFNAFSIEDARGPRPDSWTKGAVTFTTPEKLRTIDETALQGRPVLAVGLVDPRCRVHLARGRWDDRYDRNDRPRHIARFRAAHVRGEWRPPFLLFTSRRAKSVTTTQMLTAYSLDGWWYADGRRLRTGAPPATAQYASGESKSGANGEVRGCEPVEWMSGGSLN